MNLNIFEQNFRGRDFMAEIEKSLEFSQHSRKFWPDFLGIFDQGIADRDEKITILSVLEDFRRYLTILAWK